MIRLRMAVVTAKHEPQARHIIDSLPFGAMFEDVVGASADRGSRNELHRAGADVLVETSHALLQSLSSQVSMRHCIVAASPC